VRNVYKQSLLMSGYDEARAHQMMAAEEAKLTANLLQQGINPAAWIYNHARNSGYREQPRQAEAVDTQEADRAGEQLDRLAQIERNTRSMGNASGSPKDEWTFEKFARVIERGSEKDVAAIPASVLEKFM